MYLIFLFEFIKEKYKLVGYYLDNKFINKLLVNFYFIIDIKIFLKFEEIKNFVFIENDYKLVFLVNLSLKN